MGLIYLASNLITNKNYIGQTIGTLEKRKAKHLQNSNTELNNKFYQAIRKHGIDSFEWEILEEIEGKDNLDEREIYWIKEFNTLYEGYNMTIGGGTLYGHKHTDKTKKKISESRKGISMKDIYIEKYGEIKGMEKYEGYIEKLNQTNGKGKKRIDIFIERHGEEEGRKRYQQMIDNIKKSNSNKEPWMKGKKHTVSTKKIMREKQLGEKNNNYDKIFSKETRLKMSIAQKKRRLLEKTKKGPIK